MKATDTSRLPCALQELPPTRAGPGPTEPMGTAHMAGARAFPWLQPRAGGVPQVPAWEGFPHLSVCITSAN